jgi:hypothetical protein
MSPIIKSIPQEYAELAAKAKTHLNTEFPYLFGLAAVRLWTTLEATMNDVLIGVLLHDDCWKKSKKTRRIRGALVSFSEMTDADKMRLILSELSREDGIVNKSGVDRFDALLDSLGIAGHAHAAISKRLKWLAETRHILVHRRGIVDAKFKERCPWVDVKVRDTYVVKPRPFQLAKYALLSYTGDVAQRLGKAGVLEFEPLDAEKAKKFHDALTTSDEW